MKKEYLLTSIDDLSEIVHDIIDSDYSIICLTGHLGSGKTTLVKSICKILQTEDSASSPTFSLINEYPFHAGKVIHMDLYRLESSDELFDIGIEHYLDQAGYLFIEWPELAIPFLDDYLHLQIQVIDDSSRKIVIL